MNILFLFLSVAAVSMRTLAADIPLTVEDSGSKEVDKLVLQLVSTRPAPHRDGYSDTTTEEDMAVPYMTAQVSNALVRLKAMGPIIFPALVKHLRDDRYSFSDISAAWDNLTVGDAVVEVLSDGHEMFSGYKARKTRSGSGVYLSFNNYLNAQVPGKWANGAKEKTRLEIQLDFIDWCVLKENERGFVDDAQRKHILDRYAEARKEVRREYSEPGGPANRSQPIRPGTNSTPAADDSRR
jgi:hypothetical protein